MDVDAGGARHRAAAVGARDAARVRAQAAGGDLAAAPYRGKDRGGAPWRAGGVRARLPAARSLVQPGCDRAQRVAHGGVAPRAAGVEPLQRGRARLRPTRRPWLCERAARDVDGPGARHCRGDAACADQSGCARCRAARAAAVVHVARDRVVDQSAARAPGGGALARATPVPAPVVAPNLGLLRHLRGCAGPLAAAGQFPGISRGPDRPPHLAHQHRHGAAGQPVRLRLRLPHRRRRRAAHRRHPAHPGRAGAPPRAFLQLVRHAHAAADAAALCVHGGQRQPRRPPHHLAGRPARARHRPDRAGTTPRRLARHLRHRRVGAGHCAGSPGGVRPGAGGRGRLAHCSILGVPRGAARQSGDPGRARGCARPRTGRGRRGREHAGREHAGRERTRRQRAAA